MTAPVPAVPGESEEPRCGRKVGTKPWWMGDGQYDPCRCLLSPGHDGDCACSHTLVSP